MKKVSSMTSSLFEAKGSKFFGFLMPYAVFEETMRNLRSSHPKAVHFVSAFRRFPSVQTLSPINEGFGDDGEPKGSSGMPTLKVLRGEELVESAAITVRYFGGTLLGVGGLARAYAQSTLLCVKEAQKSGALVPFEVQETVTAECSRSFLRKAEHWSAKFEVESGKRDFLGNSVRITFKGSAENLKSFLNVCGQNLKIGS